jgi:hypothetical protein
MRQCLKKTKDSSFLNGVFLSRNGVFLYTCRAFLPVFKGEFGLSQTARFIRWGGGDAAQRASRPRRKRPSRAGSLAKARPFRCIVRHGFPRIQPRGLFPPSIF